MINLSRLSEYPIVCPDTETTGLKWKTDKMFGVAVAAWDERDERIVSGYWDIREEPRVVEVLDHQLHLCKRVVNHNMKFDAHMLREAGIRVPLDKIECTSVRAALIDEHEPSFGLDALGLKHVGRGKETSIYEELAQMFGGKPTKDVQMKNLHRAPARVAGKYAAPDAEVALGLWMWQEGEIGRQNLHKVWSLERALTPVLIDIEQFGIRVDEELAHRQMLILDRKIDEAQFDLNRVAGKEFNANSPKQMKELFQVYSKPTGIQMQQDDGTWRELLEWRTGGSDILLVSTDAGNASLDADALEILENLGDERAKYVQTLRKFTKARQFFANHILGHAINGRVYPNYNQTRGDTGKGTGTGRLSIDDPALQQIPARDVDVASLVRPCFLPEEGHDWECADWSQFEFRWFAHYTEDEAIINVYTSDPDADFHQTVAGITGIPRNAKYAGAPNAKQINLGLVFGMGQGEMAYQMGLDFTTRRDKRGREWKNAGPKAIGIFQTYHGAIPGVQKLLDQASSIARARGYVRTVMERRIRFPGRKATHKAGGLVFQGTSADCMKYKMITLHRMSKQHGFHYMLSVHDEHNLSIPKGKTKRITPLVKTELELFDGVGCPISCRVPIRSNIKVGANWWEASKKDD